MENRDMEIKKAYEVLGVTKQANSDELKTAYRKLVKKWHPDLHPGDPNAETKFKEVAEAYHIITEARKEKKDAFSFKNIFKNDSKEKSEPNEQPVRQTVRGSDIYTILNLSYEESLVGCKKRLNIQREKCCRCRRSGHIDSGCPECNGTGRVYKNAVIELKVRSNVKNGQTLRIKGKGNEGSNEGEYGDLIITLKVNENSTIFERRELDIYCKIFLTFPEAVLGVIKTIPTIYGGYVYKIPSGIKPGTKICLPGKGILDEETGELGNEYVLVSIKLPKIDSSEKREFVKKIQGVLYDNIK